MERRPSANDGGSVTASTGAELERLIDVVDHWIDLWREAADLHAEMPDGVRAVLDAEPGGPAAVLPKLVGLPASTIAETIELLELLAQLLRGWPNRHGVEHGCSRRLRLVR